MAYPKNELKYEQAEKLVPVMLATLPGELLDYDRISEVLDRQFGDAESRQILMTARNLAAEKGKHFMTKRGEGLRAFRPQDYEAQGTRKVATVHTAARTGYKIVDSISKADFAGMSHSQQLRHSIRQGQLEMLEKQSAAARFENVVNRNHNGAATGWDMRAVAREFASLENRKPKREI